MPCTDLFENSPTPRSPESPPRLLLVDDEPALLDLMFTALTRQGYAIERRSSGQEAIEVLEHHTVDLVLLDLRMEGIDGYQVLDWIRERHDDVTLPVIVATASDESADVVTCLDRGANDFVTKPIDLAVIQARIRTQLGRSLAVRRVRESESRMSTLLEASLESILQLDAAGRILEANPAASRLLRRDPQTLRGQPLTAFLEEGALLDPLPGTDTAQDPGIRRETALQDATGRWIPVEIAVSPVTHHGSGDRIAVIHDLTARRMAEAAVRERETRDIEIGGKIQRCLLMGQRPREARGLDVAMTTLPSRLVDGDFYDVIEHGPDRVDIVLGDVMGKGIPAALLGAATKKLLAHAYLNDMKQEVEGPADLRRVIQRVSDDMSPQLSEFEAFVTLSSMRIDLEAGHVEHVDCGHTHLIHYSSRHRKTTLHKSQNLPLGILVEERYESHTFPIEDGDILVTFSDGITEARNPRGEEFGLDRLCAVIAESSQRCATSILADVHHALLTFREDQSFDDDVSCVVVRVDPEHRSGRRVEHRFPNRTASLPGLRDALRAHLTDTEHPLGPEEIGALELGANEIAANIIEHGELDGIGTTFDMHLDASPERTIVEFSYQGIEFDGRGVPTPRFDGSRDGGFGLFIAAEVFDEVIHTRDERGRQRIVLLKRHRAPHGARPPVQGSRPPIEAPGEPGFTFNLPALWS